MITGTEAEYQPDARYTKDNPYLALKGEIWVVFCECLWENWPRYNGTALYLFCFWLFLNVTTARKYGPYRPIVADKLR